MADFWMINIQVRFAGVDENCETSLAQKYDSVAVPDPKDQTAERLLCIYDSNSSLSCESLI